MRKIWIVLALGLLFAAETWGQQSRYILVKESRVPTINAWLLNHPQLDPRGGGDKTFDAVKLGTNSAPGSTIRARACQWTLPASWWIALRDKIAALGWKRNTTDADNDVSDYLAANWTKGQVLADTTRKPVALVVIEEAE